MCEKLIICSSGMYNGAVSGYLGYEFQRIGFLTLDDWLCSLPWRAHQRNLTICVFATEQFSSVVFPTITRSPSHLHSLQRKVGPPPSLCSGNLWCYHCRFIVSFVLNTPSHFLREALSSNWDTRHPLIGTADFQIVTKFHLKSSKFDDVSRSASDAFPATYSNEW